MDQHRALDGALADGYQLDSAPAFADGVFLISQRGINHAERTETRCIIGLVAHGLLEFFSGANEGGASSLLIAAKPGDNTLAPTVGEWNVFLVTPADGHGGQHAFSSGRIALA